MSHLVALKRVGFALLANLLASRFVPSWAVPMRPAFIGLFFAMPLVGYSLSWLCGYGKGIGTPPAFPRS